MKRNNLLALFFNEPTKYWSFTEILKRADISRPQAAAWLKKLAAEELIIRVKKRKKMPYYLANYTAPKYKMKKRVFALEQLEQSGLLAQLDSLPEAQAVYLFGSLSRWDWHTKSDVDIFIYGNEEGLDIFPYEQKLGREIQLFICHNNKELEHFNPALLHNILKGYRVKGELYATQA